MNEIIVKVDNEPGKISWNFEEIKKRLEEELEIYRKTAYTDDTIKTAKSDVADLRKLAATIEERRKEVKDQYLKPYNVIEAQAKELVSLIDKPIQVINEQVQDYEKRRKEKARAEILAYWQQKSVALPEEIREKAKAAIYDSRWENATATKKSWHEGIDGGIQRITDEIATIKSFQSEFEEDAMAVYYADLSLQKAIQKMNELKAQQERILEMERRKKEREEQEARARQEAEERRQAAEQAARQQEAQPPIPESQKPVNTVEPERPHTPMERPIDGNDRQNFQRAAQPENTRAYPNGVTKQIRILGTEHQVRKILDYIKFTGASYQEV